jgi:hypothetical protein
MRRPRKLAREWVWSWRPGGPAKPGMRSWSPRPSAPPGPARPATRPGSGLLPELPRGPGLNVFGPFVTSRHRGPPVDLCHQRSFPARAVGPAFRITAAHTMFLELPPRIISAALDTTRNVDTVATTRVGGWMSQAQIDEGGDGANEIRSWISVAAAMSDCRVEPIVEESFIPGWNVGGYQLAWDVAGVDAAVTGGVEHVGA